MRISATRHIFLLIAATLVVRLLKKGIVMQQSYFPQNCRWRRATRPALNLQSASTLTFWTLTPAVAPALTSWSARNIRNLMTRHASANVDTNQTSVIGHHMFSTKQHVNANVQIYPAPSVLYHSYSTNIPASVTAHTAQHPVDHTRYMKRNIAIVCAKITLLASLPRDSA